MLVDLSVTALSITLPLPSPDCTLVKNAPHKSPPTHTLGGQFTLGSSTRVEPECDLFFWTQQCGIESIGLPPLGTWVSGTLIQYLTSPTLYPCVPAMGCNWRLSESLAVGSAVVTSWFSHKRSEDVTKQRQ